AEVVVPAVFAVDAPPLAVLFASSDTGVSTVGWVNSVRVSLGGAVGSGVLNVTTGGSGHAGVGTGLVVAP
ncbi:MAG TPA: hypothetical protein VGU64_10720, partial [Terriglobales bacterium]|nr:hypothetical protein [Terriglobales bacterium]